MISVLVHFFGSNFAVSYICSKETDSQNMHLSMHLFASAANLTEIQMTVPVSIIFCQQNIILVLMLEFTFTYARFPSNTA